MPFTVSLHKDPKLMFNVKYRNGFQNAPLFVTTAVNIGNFSNLNLFADNSVELACGQEIPPISTYERATESNIIKIQWGSYTVIGFITDWDYINDGNVKLTYIVDAFTSAVDSGMITNAEGLCARTNMSNAQMRSNLQSEPFSPSDKMHISRVLTGQFNDAAINFEELSPSPQGISHPDTRFILTVSPAVVTYLNATPFMSPPTTFPQQLKSIANLDFYAGDTTIHCGGTFRGTPLKFTHMFELQDFIKQILGGCGFRTTLSPNGYDTQQATMCRQYLTNENTGAGQARNTEKNEASDPMEAIRFITVADIYNLYCIPAKWANDRQNFDSQVDIIENFKSLGNLHRWGAEDTSKFKLLSHPYYYCRVVTANGDATNIIPQTHFVELPPPNTDHRVVMTMRFIGGDTPRIMARFHGRTNEGLTSFNRETVADWFTVRSYPSITLSINDSFNPQIQRDMANTRKISSVQMSSRISAQLSNPIKQGYIDSVNGLSANKKTNTAQSAFNQLGTMIGGGLYEIDKLFGGSTMFQDKSGLDAWNERRSLEAGNFLSADTMSIMGNDFASQFGIPAFAVYECGATDTEQWTFCRYIDEFGAACNSILNPITNAGSPMGGECPVISVNGKTFYQFQNIIIDGNMPIQWKNNIKGLFESGCYLLN